ncbi:MAG: DUF4139 domain-containing protein [Polyangiaceae bacterium]|nr:DUF4139 domain-containing protein [Polyangiaceae bacterium]
MLRPSAIFIGIAATTLVSVGCATAHVSTDQLPLRRVVVYRNGVGYFERAGQVEAEEVTFKVRRSRVGDFLATLAIVERGGSSVRSASFPLELDDETPSDPEPPHPFLKPLPASGPAPKVDPDPLRKVVLRLDGKEHDLAIGYVVETPVWRPSYRLVVHPNGQADLQAWGIVQNLSGEAWEDVRLTLVAGAPLAFESTLGDPVIPRRPVVTDTGEVIAAVPEGETSVEEKQAETDRYGGEYGAPPPPPAPMGDYAPAEPAADEMSEGERDDDGAAPGGYGRGGGGMAAKPKKAPMRLSASSGPKAEAADMPAAAAPPMSRAAARRQALEEARRSGLSQPRRVSALAAVAVESGTTRYDIPDPVTIPDESATMVLLVSQRVPGEAVFLFAPDGGVPDSATHPFRVARFTNATRGMLERGPIAVFEKGSFLGQGLVESLPKNAKATVPFALERSLAVESKREYEELGARIHKIEAGMLTIDRDAATRTIYTARNGDEHPAKLLIKHPRISGTQLHKPLPGTEDNLGTGSALIPIQVKAHGRAELTVDERQPQTRVVDWLDPLADEAVQGYLADSRANADAARRLRELWVVRAERVKLSDERGKLMQEQQELTQATYETRRNLDAIEKNAQAGDLRGKLMRRLTEWSGRLEQITKRLVELNMALSEAEVRFRDGVREIKILEPLPRKE